MTSRNVSLLPGNITMTTSLLQTLTAPGHKNSLARYPKKTSLLISVAFTEINQTRCDWFGYRMWWFHFTALKQSQTDHLCFQSHFLLWLTCLWLNGQIVILPTDSELSLLCQWRIFRGRRGYFWAYDQIKIRQLEDADWLKKRMTQFTKIWATKIKDQIPEL